MAIKCISGENDKNGLRDERYGENLKPLLEEVNVTSMNDILCIAGV